MNSISEITRRDIIDLVKRGYTEFDFLGNRQNVFYIYYGRLTEIEFLKNYINSKQSLAMIPGLKMQKEIYGSIQ